MLGSRALRAENDLFSDLTQDTTMVTTIPVIRDFNDTLPCLSKMVVAVDRFHYTVIIYFVTCLHKTRILEPPGLFTIQYLRNARSRQLSLLAVTPRITLSVHSGTLLSPLLLLRTPNQ